VLPHGVSSKEKAILTIQWGIPAFSRKDSIAKDQKPAFRSWFDTCLTDGRQASP
jgi:hypothetical protein